MNEEDEDTIKQIAIKFRQAIERTPKAKLPERFANFPAMCCGDASRMLGKYLEQRGYDPVLVETRTVRFDPWVRDHLTNTDHAWLRLGTTIVDITADQYGQAKVIVSSDSPWHEKLEARRSVNRDFRLHGALDRAYEVVLAVPMC